MDQAVKLLPKIIQHMKKRHQEKNYYPIGLEDILEEINQLDKTPTKIKLILENEVLNNNEKIEVKNEPDGKKIYIQATIKFKKSKDLIELLKKYQVEGKGGLYLDDVQESLPNADRIIEAINKSTENNVEIKILNGKYKKKILFYNEKVPIEQIKVDQEIVEHWRKVQIDGLDENKLEDYLETNKIASMKGKVEDDENKASSSTKGKTRKSRQFKKHNEHLTGVLDDYNPDLIPTARAKKQ